MLIPFLQCSSERVSVDQSPGETTVMLAAVQINPILRLSQQCGLHPCGEIPPKLIHNRSIAVLWGPETLTGTRDETALPRIILGLQCECWCRDVRCNPLCEEAFPFFISCLVCRDTFGVETILGTSVGLVHVAHRGVILWTALLVEKETAVWDTGDFCSAICGGRDGGGPAITVQESRKASGTAP